MGSISPEEFYFVPDGRKYLKPIIILPILSADGTIFTNRNCLIKYKYYKI